MEGLLSDEFSAAFEPLFEVQNIVLNKTGRSIKPRGQVQCAGAPGWASVPRTFSFTKPVTRTVWINGPN